METTVQVIINGELVYIARMDEEQITKLLETAEEQEENTLYSSYSYLVG